MRARDVRYAWNGDVALAYEVFGDGPVDLIYLQGYASHLDWNWHSPYLARFLRGLGSLARVIHTDRRGWGCSDRFSPGDVAPIEVQVDDLIAVMDAAGSERAVIFSGDDTTPAAVLFAASHPERAAGWIMVDPGLFYWDDDRSRRAAVELTARMRHEWGTPAWDHFGSTWSDEREFRDWFVPWCRASEAPGAVAAEYEAFGRDVDVRGVLPFVNVPTLVVLRADRVADEEMSLPAQVISGARLLVQDFDAAAGPPFHWYQRAPQLLAAIGDFIAAMHAEEESLDRVLATVLFTDIVDSTRKAAELGDRGWREVVERHQAIVRGMLSRYRGVEVDTAGDGFFTTFDGPARAVKCATVLVDAVKPLGIQIRAGVHTGEVESIAGKSGGMAVVIGARIGALAGASEVLASQTVKDLTAGSGITYEDTGERDLKGVPERWHVYRVTGTQPT